MENAIGFIGLGGLGTPIALNLRESGNKLFVYNRTASKTAPLANAGATVCSSAEEVAENCRIVFTILSDDHALKLVTDDLLKQLPPASIHVSMSTILPQTAQDLAIKHEAYQSHYFAAPVFGRPEAAAARKLNFAVSGDPAVRLEIEPLLKQAGASGIWDFGTNITAANTVKLCGNFLIASALEAIGESTGLAQKSGIDPQQMWAMFTQTIFTSPVYQNYSRIILEKKFDPAAFTMKLGLKDLNLVLEQAAASGHQMPLAVLLQQHMHQLVHAGNASIDWSAVSLAAAGEPGGDGVF